MKPPVRRARAPARTPAPTLQTVRAGSAVAPRPPRSAPPSRVRGSATAGGDPAVILRHWREAVPEDRLAHLVKDATRLLNRALQERLAQHDVPFGHWTFLRILWEHDGLTQRALSGQAGVMEPTTHAALNAMEARGLIERRRQPGDQRNQHIFVTAAGKKLKARLVPHAIEVNRLAVRGLSAADVGSARRVLLGIIENLAAGDAAGRPASDPAGNAASGTARATARDPSPPSSLATSSPPSPATTPRNGKPA